MTWTLITGFYAFIVDMKMKLPRSGSDQSPLVETGQLLTLLQHH